MNYQLDKSLWTDQDFDQMGWHDAAIYALGFKKDEENYNNSLLLDIDYIFKWREPVAPADFFTFDVAPCTLEFIDAHDLVIDIETGNTTTLEIEIDDIQIIDETTLEDGSTVKSWKLELHNGEITFKARGYKQYVRKAPMHIAAQSLSLSERGGMSLERKTI